MRNLELFIRKREKLMYILSFIYNIPFKVFNIFKGSIYIKTSGAFVKNCRCLIRESNNNIIISKGCRLKNCDITIYGCDNEIIFENDCEINGVDIWCADKSTVILKSKVHITGHTHLASTEGKSIIIGENSLFSSDIVVRNGDSHSIITTGEKRINFAKDVIIGKHCWIGQNVTILKGTVIGNNCVIGTGSILTGGNNYTENSLIVGSPAKIVKNNINWCPNLI